MEIPPKSNANNPPSLRIAKQLTVVWSELPIAGGDLVRAPTPYQNQSDCTCRMRYRLRLGDGTGSSR
jgi:hypothetical protein